MEQQTEKQALLKRYLLGVLTEENDIRTVEESILVDDDFFEELQITENELIEDYLNAKLNPEEKEQFESHFLFTNERRQNLQFTLAFDKYLNNKNPAEENNAALQSNIVSIKPDETNVISLWKKIFYSSHLRFAAILLLFIGLGFVAWRILFHRSEFEKGIEELRAAHRIQRPVEPRISVLSYAPFSNLRNGNNQSNQIDSVSRDRAARYLLDSVKNDPQAKSHHALGCYYLSEKQFDKAKEQFEIALKLAPDDAQIYGDLGAVYLAQAESFSTEDLSGKRLENLAKGLENFNKALDLDNSRTEALFNKALCLQKMNLFTQSKQAWQQYLEKEANPEWSKEAKERIKEIENNQKPTANSREQVLQDFLSAYNQKDDERAWMILSQTKEMITETMIFPQLARRFLEAKTKERNEEAISNLTVMFYLGNLEANKTYDPFFSELANYYQESPEDFFSILLMAQNEMRVGYELCLKSNYNEAMSHFEVATRLFGSKGNSWESQIAVYWISYCQSRNTNIIESTSLSSSVIANSEKKKYKWLLAQMFCLIGGNDFLQSEYSKAIEHTELSLKLSREISDTYNTQKALAQLTNLYTQLNDAEQALRYIQEGLSLTRLYFSSPRQLWRNYFFASKVFYALSLHETAIACGHEMLETGLRKINDPAITHNSYLFLSIIYSGAKKHQESLRLANESLKIADVFESNLSYKPLQTYSILQIAHINRNAGDYETALKNYGNALYAYSQKDPADNATFLYETQKGKLLCHLALKNTDSVQKELPVVLDLFESYRQKILEEKSRNTFFDNEQNIYDIAIDFSYQGQQTEKAFEYAENSKARSLLNLISHKSTQINDSSKSQINSSVNPIAPLPLQQIQKRMPEQVQIVQYALLPDKILIWVISQKQFDIVEKRLTQSDINLKVFTYIKLLGRWADNQNELRILSQQLYDILIQPIFHLLDKNKQICIVPDKSFYYLSFASLQSPQTGKYLLEEFVSFLSPSASVFILCTESARRYENPKSESILVIGNPAFDKKSNPDLQDLPSAETEAKETAKLYGSYSSFVGQAATKDRILEKFRDTNIIHFAGHYIVNENAQMQSKMVLAKSSAIQGNEDLSADEIFNHKPQNTKLVILSACQTAIEHYYNGEGMIGAARTFLATGTPLVIASQWSVDSKATAELMIKFHRYRKQQNLTTVMALREAQLDLLSQAETNYSQPFYWAAFLSIGGFAAY